MKKIINVAIGAMVGAVCGFLLMRSFINPSMERHEEKARIKRIVDGLQNLSGEYLKSWPIAVGMIAKIEGEIWVSTGTTKGAWMKCWWDE